MALKQTYVIVDIVVVCDTHALCFFSHNKAFFVFDGFLQPSENINVKVCGKVRPLTETENSRGCKRVVKAQGSSITIDVSNKVI